MALEVKRQEVTWQKNQKAEGVVAFDSSRTVIFPSRPDFLPPQDAGALPRHDLPEAGVMEECVLIPNPNGTTYFAYPAGLDVEEHRGSYSILDADGVLILLAPAEPLKFVGAKWENGSLHICTVFE